MIRPVVIIGAPRSGTNMLRDVLTRLPGVATWPCDEINFVWRHGNREQPSDELDYTLATERVRSYIRRQFGWVARRFSATTVVEKTCANSLRVPFVSQVLPEARYLFIRRNGIDAAISALNRWDASTDLRYLVRKARFIPRSDIPHYAGRFVTNRLRRAQGTGTFAGWWGPRLVDSEQLLQRYALDEVCALQWQRCVEASTAALEAMPPERVLELSYEDFVAQPHAVLARTLDFLGHAGPAAPALVRDVSATSVGKGRKALTPDRQIHLETLVEPTLRRFGYV